MNKTDMVASPLRRLTGPGTEGLRIAIDHIGTGYCSLSHRKRLPIDTTKIDRSFVMDTHGDNDDAATAATVGALTSIAGSRKLRHAIG